MLKKTKSKILLDQYIYSQPTGHATGHATRIKTQIHHQGTNNMPRILII
jgi:hypothetical protein